MALARTTSPAIVLSGYEGVSPVSLASNTFSPPAGAIIVCTAMATNSYAPGGWSAATITDSLGSHLTWTAGATMSSDVVNKGGTWTWWAYCPSSQTNMTVTPTLAAGAGQYIVGMAVAIDVWTGANTSNPIGASANGAFTGQDLTESLTPNATGSALMMAATDAAVTGTPTAGTGFYLLGKDAGAGNWAGGTGWYGTSSAFTPSTASTAENLSIVGGTSSAVFDWVTYEVLAAAPSVPTIVSESAFSYAPTIEVLSASVTSATSANRLVRLGHKRCLWEQRRLGNRRPHRC